MPHLLILTAGFGEGHNTAARCLAEAMRDRGEDWDVLVADPLADALPRLNALARRIYLGLINHAPALWKPVYHLADYDMPLARPGGWLAPAARRMRALIDRHQPAVVVSTYPLYGLFWEQFFPQGSAAPCPYTAIVTDSISINGIWLRGRVDHWCVTDPGSAERVHGLGAPAERIHVTGFPVSPRFSADSREIAPPAPGEPWRLLVFPTSSKSHTRALLGAIAALPKDLPFSLTIALGKQKNRLGPLIEGLRTDLPANPTVLGWTDRIPEIMAAHHVVIGKAGGATVHEVRAAARPMVIHSVVPGQEEGNAILLENEGGGARLESPGELTSLLRRWADGGFHAWQNAHRALLEQARPDGARRAASLVASLAASRPSPSEHP